MTEAERYMSTTPFQVIYDGFFTKITDDMYLSWTKEDTEKDIINILLAAIPRFEYPKFKLYDYDPATDVVDSVGNIVCKGFFKFILTREEVELFAELMLVEWIKRQITTIDNTRMKYGSSDFKLTSQANHIEKLIKMKSDFEATNRRGQRLYNRRKTDENGYIRPNFSGLGGGIL